MIYTITTASLLVDTLLENIEHSQIPVEIKYVVRDYQIGFVPAEIVLEASEQFENWLQRFIEVLKPQVITIFMGRFVEVGTSTNYEVKKATT